MYVKHDTQYGADYGVPTWTRNLENGGGYGGTYDFGFNAARGPYNTDAGNGENNLTWDVDFVGVLGGRLRFAVPRIDSSSEYGSQPYGDSQPLLTEGGDPVGQSVPVADEPEIPEIP